MRKIKVHRVDPPETYEGPLETVELPSSARSLLIVRCTEPKSPEELQNIAQLFGELTVMFGRTVLVLPKGLDFEVWEMDE